MTERIAWPDGKQFAFTIHDDADAATFQNVGKVYGFLADLGFRTTKSCWALRGDSDRGEFPAQTLEDDDYRKWLQELVAKGFGIDWHGATWHGATRRQILEALARFESVFQSYPQLATNHTGNEDAMYWGSARLSGWRRRIYDLLTCYRNYGKYRGHIEGDEHFWGDLCQKHVKYYRNFVFQDINTLKACPLMPYHDTQKPYVNYWFASSNGRDVKTFNRCLSEKNQDRLEAEGGACIIYTHLALGFDEGSRLNRRFEQLMQRLAKKNGWFVQCTTLLDHLLATRGRCELTDAQRRRLELKWLLEKLFVGST